MLSRRRRAFTLVELLTVIAVIGILASILIPVVGGVQNSAKKAKTRVQFSQWAAAIEAFRQEYGYYPNIPSKLVNGDSKLVNGDSQLFREVLTGQGAGTTAANFISSEQTLATAQNKKRIRFLSFGQDEISNGQVVNAFGGTAIAVLVDKNYDGRITIGAPPANDYATGDLPTEIPSPFKPNEVIHAGVIFYCTVPDTSNSEFVKSWNEPTQ